MRAIIYLAVALLAAALLTLCGCPSSPDAEKAIQEKTKVPGLEEAVIAKDRTIKTAIEVLWASDVELLQEQLAVEEVRAGKVRITGIVSRQKLKDRAEAMVREQEGVTDVISTITVDESLREKRINLDEI